MRELIVAEFITLDGVIQAPGGADEDTEGGFKHGGWTLPYWHDDIGTHFFQAMSQADAFLLGRKTWQIHGAAFEPMAGDPFGDALNNIPKYVVSSQLNAVDVSSGHRDSLLFGKSIRRTPMKRSLTLVLAFVLGAGVSGLTQSSKDAVAVDPTHHHVIMENPRVRVFEVLGAPGDKSPMHTHPPLVAVSLNKARLRMTTPDGKNSIFDVNPGQAIWMENVEHSWELLAGQLHLVVVEVKGGR